MSTQYAPCCSSVYLCLGVCTLLDLMRACERTVLNQVACQPPTHTAQSIYL